MSKLQEWKDRADKMALSLKMDIAVVDNGGSYQLWPVSKSGANHQYIAKCGGTKMNQLAFDLDEMKKIRELLHRDILSQKVGKYTLSNKLAKKLDELMEVTE